MSGSSQSGKTAVEVISHNSKAVLWGLFVLIMFILAVYFAVVMANSSSSTIQTLNTVFIAAVSGSLALGGTLISQLWGKEDNISRPVIVTKIPDDGQDDIAVNTTVYATFDRTMDRSSINHQTFTLREEGATNNIEAKVSLGGGAAVLKPSNDLTLNTRYSVTITKDVKDIAGNTLGKDETWSFTTQEQEQEQ